MKQSAAGQKKKLFDEGDDSSTSSSSSDSSSSDSSSSSPEPVQLKVNKSYAKEYQSRKQREELRQVQQKEGGIGSDESSSEEEDEDGNLLTNSVNLQFLKTITALRKKENSVYDRNKQFFDEPTKKGEDKSLQDDGDDSKKRKPQRFKDVLREQILEKMNDEEASNEDDTFKPENSKFAYDKQQEELRKAFLKESGAINEQEIDGEGDSWMVVKKKGVKFNDAKEGELLEQFQEIEKLSTGEKSDDKFSDPRGEIEDGNKFLLEYIKNKKWIDKSRDYDDDDDDDDDGKDDDDESSLDDIDRADDFEAKYNFRFEQAEAEATSGAHFSIQTYARGQTMNTVRRKDTTRADKRLARKERKAAERKAKEEQLKRLKNAKRQEMDQKLSQVKAVLGAVEEEAVDEAAIMKMLEGDYDPEKFEKAMNEAYGDDFYEKEDGEWKSDLDVRKSLKDDEDGEAVIGQDDVNGGMYDTYDGEEGGDEEDYDETGEKQGGEEDFGDGGEAMDVEGYVEETELEKKLKAKMQDELYKLDYEDIVAGMPTRFKYRQVERNNYGVSAQEILLARDSTLKQFVSLKKMAPYTEDGEYAVNSKKRRRFREMLKQDIDEETGAEALVGEEAAQNEEEDEVVEPTKKKRRRLKKGKKRDTDAANETDKASTVSPDESTTVPSDDAKESIIPDQASGHKSKGRPKKKGKKDDSSESASKGNLEPVVEKPAEEMVGPSDVSKDKPKKVDREKKHNKRKKKKGAIAGLPASRLTSYGL